MTVDSQMAADAALTCIAPGCTRPPVAATGAECSTHRSRRQRLGSYDLPPKRPKVEHGRCAAPGCDRNGVHRIESTWYCNIHHYRIKRHGSTELPEGSSPRTRKPTDPCAAPDCDRLQRRGGYCGMHHARMKRHGSTEPPQRTYTPPPPCAAPGCDRQARGYSNLSVYCGKHQHQARRVGVDGMAAVRECGDRRGSINAGPCRVDGCDRPARGRGLCATHYSRWYRSGTTGLPPKRRLINGGACLVPDCTSIAASRGMCPTHYGRWCRAGSTDAPERVQPTCAVDGCARSTWRSGRGWCTMHYRRWRRHGDPLVVKPGGGWRGDDIGYFAAHDRVKHERGVPSTHTCIDCGQPAKDWGYTNSGIGEKVDERGYRYSVDITQYDAMCKLCHNRRDKLAAARRRHGGQEPACAASGCTQPPRTRTALECKTHYQRRQTYGSYDLPERPKRRPGLCVAEGCDRQARGYTGNAIYCNTHRPRIRKRRSTAAPQWRDTPPGARRRQVSDTPCSVPGCVRPISARGWCFTHYNRWYATGSTEQADRTIPVCAVDGCTASTRPGGRGWCSRHYQRWCRRGDPLAPKLPPSTRMGDAISYFGAHARVQRARGRATGFPCVDCGHPAAAWAYTNSGIGEKVNERGQRYSVDTGQYDAMCRPCHSRRDRLEQARRRRATIGKPVQP